MVDKTIGRNSNTTNEAVVSDQVEMTSGGTAEVVVVAKPNRIYLAVTVTGKDAYIRLIPAATDGSVRKGIFLKKDTT